MKHSSIFTVNRLAVTVVFALALLFSSVGATWASPVRGAASATPKAAITSFYNAINNWNFGTAYSYIDPKGRPSFYPWAHGYTTTKKVTITALNDPGYRITVSGSVYTCVGIRFTSTYYTTSRTSTYGGWYMTRYSGKVNWRIYLPGTNIALNAKAITPTPASCSAHIK